MSDRKITHIVPVDGTEHTPVECYCHPDVSEANGVHALMGLEDVGISEDEPGALVFAHHKAAEASRWQLCEERDSDELLTIE